MHLSFCKIPNISKFYISYLLTSLVSEKHSSQILSAVLQLIYVYRCYQPNSLLPYNVNKMLI